MPSMTQTDITKDLMYYCLITAELHSFNYCQLQLLVVRHVAIRVVKLTEGFLEHCVSREGLLPEAEECSTIC